MTRCALCLARHDNTTVCDDCACAVAADNRRSPRRDGDDVSEDAPTTTLDAEVRRAIADICRAYVGRCAEAVALRAQTAEEWRLVGLDCATAWDAVRSRRHEHAAAVAARLMAEGDAETAARELAAVRGQTVEAWREELTHDRNTAAREP